MVIRQGALLQKQKQVWKERYFVLYQTRVVCYKSSDRKKADARGDFDLSSHAHLEVMPVDQQQKSGTSVVSEWRFALSGKDQHFVWVSELRLVIRLKITAGCSESRGDAILDCIYIINSWGS